MKEKIQNLFRTVQEKLHQPERNLKFKISQGVLTGCHFLPHEKQAVVPAGVHTVGSSAFYHCEYLESILLPDSVKSIRLSAFGNCRRLKFIRLPDSIVSIGDEAFSGCQSLEEIVLPPKMTALAKNLFKDCYALKKVQFPEQVLQLETGVFSGCLNLEEVCLPAYTAIPDYFFQNCRNLRTVSIPFVSGRIGTGAFQNCESLKNIVLPSRIRTISDYAFINCTSLTGIQIPENVQTVGHEAFKNSGLEYVVLPSTVTKSGREVFAGCAHLERVIFSGEIKEISASMFRDCTNLKQVCIPDGTEIISSYAFSGCKSLTDITFPESLLSVSYTAFTLCHELREIHWHSLDFSVKSLCSAAALSAPYDAIPNISGAFAAVRRSSILHDEKIIAVYQYLFGQYLQFPEQKNLAEFIQNNLHYLFCSLIAVRDKELILKLLNQELLITKQNITDFILYANQEQAYEIQVMLSEYQHTHFPAETIAETIRNKFEL